MSTDFLNGVPVIGAPIKSALQNSKKAIRRAMCHSTMFEDMGFHYFGLIDGHDEPELERIFPDRLCSARADAAPCRDEERQGLCAC